DAPVASRLEMAPGNMTVDTGGEFHLPSCLAVVRRSRAGREASRRPHLPALAHEYLPYYSRPNPLSPSPTRPGASPTPPSPRGPPFSAAPTNSGRAAATPSSLPGSPAAGSPPPPTRDSPWPPSPNTSRGSLTARPPTPSAAASPGSTPSAWS